jgi:CrcB protein
MVVVIVAVAILAGGLGALARADFIEFAARRSAHHRPRATFAVNVIGSFVLGVVVAQLDANGRAILGTGFSGGFTVYGAFALETVQQFEARARTAAMLNVIGSIVVGTLAAIAGIAIGGAW